MPALAVTTGHETVQPGDTCSGVTAALGTSGYHYVAAPYSSSDRKNVLVVFLGGALGTPSDYNDITDYVASLGYGVVDLAYPNNSLIADSCLNTNECYRQYRGEASFGKDVAYASGSPTYDSAALNVTLANSVVNRIVCAIDFLANESVSPDPIPGRSYWSQFPVTNSASPYVATNAGHVYPAWDKIVISGHSQGAGNAAFIAMHLPSGSPVRRAIIISAPQDNYNSGGSSISASWVTDASTTPLSKYWGLRNTAEGTYGNFVITNWINLGGAANGGLGVEYSTDNFNAGDGSTVPTTERHRLVTTTPSSLLTPFNNHNSTAVDGYTTLPDIEASWRYLFTANYTD